LLRHDAVQGQGYYQEQEMPFHTAFFCKIVFLVKKGGIFWRCVKRILPPSTAKEKFEAAVS
jgi:hypothetical protein